MNKKFARPQCHPQCQGKSPVQPFCNTYGHESILPLDDLEALEQYDNERRTFKEIAANLRVTSSDIASFSVDTSQELAEWHKDRLL